MKREMGIGEWQGAEGEGESRQIQLNYKKGKIT